MNLCSSLDELSPVLYHAFLVHTDHDLLALSRAEPIVQGVDPSSSNRSAF